MKSTKPTVTGPTYVTILRMVLSVLFLIFVLLPETWAKIIALILFIAGAISDKLDGEWARKQKIVTDLGAFLDPLADKMLVNLAFLALVYIHTIPVWVLAIILVRDFAVDGMRMMMARKGITIPASLYGKLKTTLQMTAIIILLFSLIIDLEFFTTIGNITLYLALAFTVFSGGDYLVKSWRKI